jgi:hypothetical protein
MASLVSKLFGRAGNVYRILLSLGNWYIVLLLLTVMGKA